MCLDISCETARGMSKNICNYCVAGKERGGGETQESQNHPKKSHAAEFLGGHGLDE